MIENTAHRTTSADLVIVATMTDEGVSCPAVRTDDGTLYTLTGLTQVPPTGERIEIGGEVLKFSKCQQGVTIRVKTLTTIIDE